MACRRSWGNARKGNGRKSRESEEDLKLKWRLMGNIMEGKGYKWINLAERTID